MDIQLPKAEEWSPAENFAENLRSAVAAGRKVCVPVGRPSTVLDDAGAFTYILPGGNVLSVTDDRHDLRFNGVAAGSVGAPLTAVLPTGDGGEALLFTSEGVEWFASGRAQGGTPDGADAAVSATVATVELTAEVVLPELRGSYGRLTCALGADDAQRAAEAVGEALRSIEAQAALRGIWVHPGWVAWRLVDLRGNVIAHGEPRRVGTLQGNSTLHFRAVKTDGGFRVDTSATMKMAAYGLHLSVGRAESDYWRKKVAALEVVTWPGLAELQGAGGAFSQVTSAESDLSLTPQLRERGRDEVNPKVVARVERPLEGVDMTLPLGQNAEETEWGGADEASDGQLRVDTAYCGGTLVAYGLRRERGVLALASSSDPLTLKAKAQVACGQIMHICAPAGGSGGWNYGRHHLLVFATDGIYAVSADGGLRTISSTLIVSGGIARADAVAVSAEAVYAAQKSGGLLEIKGTHCRGVVMPMDVEAVGRCAEREELWAITSAGVVFVRDREGGVALRSDLTVERFAGQSMVVDSAGALRHMGHEEPAEMWVSWRRREEERFRKRERRVVWQIDTEKARDLTLRLTADNGGIPQRLLELEVNGPVNAPVGARIMSPLRAYFSAHLQGYLTPPARLARVSVTG